MPPLSNIRIIMEVPDRGKPETIVKKHVVAVSVLIGFRIKREVTEGSETNRSWAFRSLEFVASQGKPHSALTSRVQVNI